MEEENALVPLNHSSIVCVWFYLSTALFSLPHILTSLWSSENSAVMLVVSLINVTSGSPSSCSREGTS